MKIEDAHDPSWERSGLQPPPVHEHPVLVLDGVCAQIAAELEEGIPCVVRHHQLVRHCEAHQRGLISMHRSVEMHTMNGIRHIEGAIPDSTRRRGWLKKNKMELLSTNRLCINSGTSFVCSFDATIAARGLR